MVGLVMEPLRVARRRVWVRRLNRVIDDFDIGRVGCAIEDDQVCIAGVKTMVVKWGMAPVSIVCSRCRFSWARRSLWCGPGCS